MPLRPISPRPDRRASEAERGQTPIRFGQRIEEARWTNATGTVTYHYGFDSASDSLWADLDNTNELVTRYVRDDYDQAPVAKVSSTGTVGWYDTDRLGSVRLNLNASGTVTDQTSYTPYGDIASETSAANGDSWKYTGERRQSDSGNQLHGGRWYDTATGTWMTRDPIGFGGGDANLTRYVRNDPLNYTDPNGLAGKKYSPEQQAYFDVLPKDLRKVWQEREDKDGNLPRAAWMELGENMDVFDRIDTNGDGLITPEEAANALGLEPRGTAGRRRDGLGGSPTSEPDAGDETSSDIVLWGRIEEWNKRVQYYEYVNPDLAEEDVPGDQLWQWYMPNKEQHWQKLNTIYERTTEALEEREEMSPQARRAARPPISRATLDEWDEYERTNLRADIEAGQKRLQEVQAERANEQTLEDIHTVLAVLGATPLGEVIAPVDGLLYIAQGKPGEALWAVAPALPGLGMAFVGSRLARRQARHALHEFEELAGRATRIEEIPHTPGMFRKANLHVDTPRSVSPPVAQVDAPKPAGKPAAQVAAPKSGKGAAGEVSGIKKEPSGAAKAPGQQYEEILDAQKKKGRGPIRETKKSKQMDREEIKDEAEQALEEIRRRRQQGNDK